MRCDREMEVRKLPLVAHYGLAQELEVGAAWKQVMALIRRTPTESLPCPIKYTTRHIKMVEEAGLKENRSCAEIFLEEWGCSGRKRPTLADLLNLLKEAELFKAADYVAVELLKESRPVRPTFGPAAEVNTSVASHQLLEFSPLLPSAPFLSSKISNNILLHNKPEHTPSLNIVVGDMSHEEGSYIDESIRIAQQLETLPLDQLDRSTPQHIPYEDLRSITNDFDDHPVGEKNGRLLGKGAFGSVHLAIQANYLTAVKKLNKDAVIIDRQFENEVEALLRLQHPNLLRMVAYSCDGPEKCLVYEFMSQGNLEERLSCQGRWKTALSYDERIKIALGTAQGIKHLHDYSDPPLVHRDVKSANILLGRDLIPKVGDFGLVRLGDSGNGNCSAAVTSTVFGTSVYMAPETFSGDVSVKTDVFSFGVVLLELLTSLSPYDCDGEGTDLITYVNEICDKTSIGPLLSTAAGNWRSKCGEDLSSQLYLLAQDCLEDKQKRPIMTSVVLRLQCLNDA